MGRGRRTLDKVTREAIVAKIGARSFDVLCVLNDHARGGEALLTATEIGRSLGFSRVSAHKHLRRLEDAGLITVGEWVTREDGTRCVSRRLGGLHRGLHEGLHLSNIVSSQKQKYTIFPRCRAGGPMERTSMSILDEIESLNQIAPYRVDVDLSLLPPYPSPEVCRLVEYPRQPVLPPQDSAAVKMMIRAYKAVTRAHCGQCRDVDRKARFRLEKVLYALRHRNVKNVWAWCAYRIHHWLDHHDDEGAPGIDWILNAPAVTKYAEAYHNISARYEHIGKVSMTDAHRELLQRWKHLHDFVRKNRGAASLVDSEVARVLPPSKYAELKTKSENQRAEIERHLYAALRHGRWIW